MFRRVAGGVLSAWLVGERVRLGGNRHAQKSTLAPCRPSGCAAKACRRSCASTGLTSFPALRGRMARPRRRAPRPGDRPRVDPVLQGRRDRRARTRRRRKSSSTARPTTTTSRSSRTVSPPPDANGAAGPDHYFQAINLVFRSSTSRATGARPASQLQPLVGPGRRLRDRPRQHAARQVRHAGGPVVREPGRLRPLRRRRCTSASRCRPRRDPTGTYNQYDFAIDPSSSARAPGSASGPRRTT